MELLTTSRVVLDVFSWQKTLRLLPTLQYQMVLCHWLSGHFHKAFTCFCPIITPCPSITGVLCGVRVRRPRGHCCKHSGMPSTRLKAWLETSCLGQIHNLLIFALSTSTALRKDKCTCSPRLHVLNTCDRKWKCPARTTPRGTERGWWMTLSNESSATRSRTNR